MNFEDYIDEEYYYEYQYGYEREYEYKRKSTFAIPKITVEFIEFNEDE